MLSLHRNPLALRPTARTASTLAAVALAALAFAIVMQMVNARHTPDPPLPDAGLPPVEAVSPHVPHTEAIEAAHLFGVPATEAADAVEVEGSPYIVSGIACMEDAGRCDPAAPAIATLEGPGGESMVQAGSRLPSGETVLEVQPDAVVLSEAGGVQKLRLKIPLAATDQMTATLPLDGSLPTSTGNPTRARAASAQDQMQANLKSLNLALQASQARLKDRAAAMSRQPPGLDRGARE